jgi:hypothetical protein
MPVTGKFAADFASFYEAVQKAEVSLRSFEAGAGKVEGSLNRMVDSFSGRLIITQATLATEAVERIGGASRLTEAEQARVNRTVSEALAKYAALGQQAPPALQALAEATKRVETPTEGLNSKMVALGSAIGTMVANAATAIASTLLGSIRRLGDALVTLTITGAGIADVRENFARLTAQAGTLGSTLLDQLHAGTHATVTDFELMKLVNQDLAAGLRLTDAQFGTLARGAFALAQATGTDVKGALDLLNDAMLTGRTRAIALLTGKIDLEHAERAYAAALGVERSALSETQKLEAARAAILDAVTAATRRLGDQTDGLDEKLAQAQTAWGNFRDRLGDALATSPVLGAAMEALGQSLVAAFGGNQERLITTIVTTINRLAISATEAGLVLIEMGRSGVQVFGAFQVPIRTVTAAMTVLVERFAAGIATMAELAAQMPGVGRAFEGTATAARHAAEFWAAARAESARGLDAATAMARGQGVVHDILGRVSGALVTMKAAMEAAALSTQRAAPAVQRLAEETATQEATTRRSAAALNAFFEEVDKFESKVRIFPPFTGLLQDIERTLAPLPRHLEAFNSGLTFTAEIIESEVAPQVDALEKKVESFTTGLGAAGRPLGDFTIQVPTPNLATGANVAGTSPRVIGYLSQGYTLGEAVSLASGVPTQIFGPSRRADGGPVSAGAPYLVGERGPELFVPRTSGAVVAADRIGAPIVHITIQGSVLGSTYEIARAVKEALTSDWMASGRRIATVT